MRNYDRSKLEIGGPNGWHVSAVGLPAIVAAVVIVLLILAALIGGSVCSMSGFLPAGGQIGGMIDGIGPGEARGRSPGQLPSDHVPVTVELAG